MIDVPNAARAAWAMLLAATLAAPVHAEPLTLRVGWAQAPSQLTALSAELMKRHPDRFPLMGKSYVLEPVRFQGSTPQIEGLAGGEVEIAALGPSSFALGVAEAKARLDGK